MRTVFDPPRDFRTVFIWQLAQRVREPEISEFFSAAGRVRDVRLVKDRSSSKHKSAGYVEFFDVGSVEKAVAMHGKVLCGIPVAVKPSVESSRGAQGGADFGAGGAGRPGDAVQQGAPTVGTAVVGWTSRQPLRPPEGQVAAPNSYAAGGAGAGYVTGNSVKLVSIEELKKLLNPLGLVPLAGNAGPVPLPVGERENGGQVGLGSTRFTRLYIGSLMFKVSEEDLRAVLEPFGSISFLQIQRDGMGRSRGYAFVEFVRHEDAKKALEIDGLMLGGRGLRVGLASHVQRGVGNGAVPLPGPTGDVAGELDEGKDGGLAMNGMQRAMLMQQLSRGEKIGGKDGRKVDVCAEGTRSLMLCNMFNPVTEVDKFELELGAEVRDECAKEYGTVVHVHVEKESQGIVYIRFGKKEDAEKARTCLNGRWFGGSRIQAYFVGDEDYAKKMMGGRDV